MTPIRSSADVTRLRAAALGLYASASIAAITAALVSGRIPSRPLIARDTVIGDTPTFAATSLIVGRRPRRPGLFNEALPSFTIQSPHATWRLAETSPPAPAGNRSPKKGPGTRPGPGESSVFSQLQEPRVPPWRA